MAQMDYFLPKSSALLYGRGTGVASVSLRCGQEWA